MDYNTEYYKKNVAAAFQKSGIIKGTLLNKVSILESMIDWFLTNHFCKDVIRQKDFLTWLMPSNMITLENKRILFKKIIEKYYPDFIKTTPTFHAILGKILDFRNEMAHFSLDISPQGIERSTISGNMVLLDKTRLQKEYTDDNVFSILDLVQKITDDISNLVSTMQTSPPISKP
jgi:hypothetical protein